MGRALDCLQYEMFVPGNTRELLVLSPVQYGMGYPLSQGTREYQKRKRQETEDRLLEHLLTSKTICGWTEIANGTTIYRNNIAPILKKLLAEDKIIKIGPYKTFGKSKQQKFNRIFRKPYYLPNIMHDHVKTLIKNLGFDTDEPHEDSDVIAINNQMIFEKSMCLDCTTLETFLKNHGSFFESDIREKPILRNLYLREIGVALINLYNVLGYPPKEEIERLG